MTAGGYVSGLSVCAHWRWQGWEQNLDFQWRDQLVVRQSFSKLQAFSEGRFLKDLVVQLPTSSSIIFGR
jgi:hypothetical protein